MAGKFQIRSKKWDIGIAIGAVVLFILGWGGLFFLHSSGNAAGGTTSLFVIVLGIITFLCFAGPGIVYVLRKRVKAVKNALPGGTMTWIRSHLYIPVLALAAALVHASVVPFRGHLSSGKVLFVLGILVSVGGLARHHLIGIQKAAINVNVAIGKLTTGQPRAFRRLVADFTDHRKPVPEIDAAMAGFDPKLQERWAKIKDLSSEVEKHFPREGGQRWHIRQYKLWRALHPPLTIALFLVLAFHVWDVFGGTRSMAGENQQFASADECAGCHGDIVEEWQTSTMSHAQTSTITEGQLPITMVENLAIAEEFGDTEELAVLTGRDLDADPQDEFAISIAPVCNNCHAPIGSSFQDDPLALLPFSDEGSASVGESGVAEAGGNDAVQSDGIGCIVCHSQSEPPAELQGAGTLLGGTIEPVSGGTYGDVFGPPFVDPNPLPVRIHGIVTPDNDFWTDEIETSQLCGACHNVKVDIDGDGLSGVFADNESISDILAAIEDGEERDEDGDFQLDENELDDNRINIIGAVPNDEGGDGRLDDLVLQTTFDEWQDYVAFFDADGGFDDRYTDAEFPNGLSRPLGCTSCHMPLRDDGQEPVVDYAPGFISAPDRFHREHTFVGVDYDLDPEVYRKNGLSDAQIAETIAERDALVQSAVTLEVQPGDVQESEAFGREFPVTVQVRNNLLAHGFPTGFAFARQFWIEVSAETSGGEPVCLSPAFINGQGAPAVNQPCGSGFADAEGTEPVEGDADLRQCDTRAMAESLGLDVDVMLANPTGPPVLGAGTDPDTGITLPNLAIAFAPEASFGADQCDPWLANFQKILTDGDPDGDGVRDEVPFQPILPDAVQIRGQVATNLAMTEIQPVRLRDGAADDNKDIVYFFQLPDGVEAADVVVTARMRFRHLPPYFVRDMGARQEELGDTIPEGARFDAEELLRHIVVAEVVTATSEDDGEQLACEGPQNGATSILDCVDEAAIDDAAERLDLGSGGGSDREQRDREGGLGTARPTGFAAIATRTDFAPEGWLLLMWGGLSMAFLVPAAIARRRTR